MATQVRNIESATLHEWLKAGEAVLIDVRPAEKFASERIEGAVSMPLATLETGSLPALEGKKLVFQCQLGVASERAGRKVLGEGFSGEVHHLVGGIAAWKRDGFPVQVPEGAVVSTGGTSLSLMRQVQIVSGFLVLLGVALGSTVSPWLYGLSAFVGAGTLFAGASGSCAMVFLLARLPFNRNAPLV